MCFNKYLKQTKYLEDAKVVLVRLINKNESGNRVKNYRPVRALSRFSIAYARFLLI